MRLDGHVSPLPRSYMVSLGALAVWIKTGCHDFCTTILLVLYRRRFQELTTKNKNPKPGDLNSPKLTKEELGRSRHEVSWSAPKPVSKWNEKSRACFQWCCKLSTVNRVPLYTHVYHTLLQAIARTWESTPGSQSTTCHPLCSSKETTSVFSCKKGYKRAALHFTLNSFQHNRLGYLLLVCIEFAWRLK